MTQGKKKDLILNYCNLFKLWAILPGHTGLFHQSITEMFIQNFSCILKYLFRLGGRQEPASL